MKNLFRIPILVFFLVVVFVVSSTFGGTYSKETFTCLTIQTIQTFVSGGKDVTIKWHTDSEFDTAGFYIWRSESEAEDGGYIIITPNVIPAEGGATLQANYSYTDETTEEGIVYYYKLEVIDLQGISSFYGPVSDYGPVSEAISSQISQPLNPYDVWNFRPWSWEPYWGLSYSPNSLNWSSYWWTPIWEDKWFPFHCFMFYLE